MMKINHVFCTILLVNVLTGLLTYAAEITPPDPARVAAYEKMLPKTPQGIGATIEDRQTWEALAKHLPSAKIIKEAEKMLKTPMPELTDDLYLDYSRTGNRDRCQAVIFKRQDRISALVLAECFENRGRFLPGIEEAIGSVCGEKTWVFPAHDGSLQNFNGKVIEIDLNSSYCSWNLATAAYWLGDKLSSKTKKLLADESGASHIYAFYQDDQHRQAGNVVAYERDELELRMPGRCDWRGIDIDRIAPAASVFRRFGRKIYRVFPQGIHARRVLLRRRGILELRFRALCNAV